MIGVNFQPGGGQGGQVNRPKTDASGIQEAIKVLSLRLPKVIGAQGIASQPLLSSPGGGGGRVDSVVNQILAKMFPTAGGGQIPSAPSFGTAPMPEAPPGAPSFGGDGKTPFQQPPQTADPYGLASFRPRVIFDGVGSQGDFTVGQDGRPMTGGGNIGGIFQEAPRLDGSAFPNAAIAPTPQFPQFPQYGAPEPPQQYEI